ncbi:hypothetical protein C6P42_001953 [Pichia californica]|nr:hypothetical protein C6P42_001953 [[Candida] californica]
MTQQIKSNRKGYPSYSKIGCQECKKAHRKCNEKTPRCERCVRKKLECKYPSNFVFNSNCDIENAKDELSSGKIKKARFSAFIPQSKNNLNTFMNKTNMPDNIKQNKKQLGIFNPRELDKNVSDELINFTSSQTIDSSIFLTRNNEPTTSPIKVTSPYSLELNKVKNPPVGDVMEERVNTITFQNEEMIISNPVILKETQELNHIVTEPKNIQNDEYAKIIELNSLFPISLTDLIPITPTDLNFLNMIDIDNDNFYSLNDTYTPYTYAFNVSWKASVTVDLVGIFQEYDPIQNLFNETGDVPLKDIRLLNFIWTLNRGTRYYFNFPMFPLEVYEQVMEIFSKLSKVYSIIQSVMTYDCAMLMTGLYKRSGQKDMLLLWDRHVRIPSFKQCLEILKERIDYVSNFSESVVLTFAVIIIFSASGSDKIWKTHLKGSYQLLLKSLSMQPMRDPNNEFDQAANVLFDILKEWFFNIEFCCQLTSNNGFHITNSMSLENNECDKDSIVMLNNNISLIGGHCQELKPIMVKLRCALMEFESRGIKLCGNNVLVFKFTNTNKSLAAELKSIGLELVLEVKALKSCYKVKETADYQMRFTLQNNDKLTRLALELYLEFFFVGNKPNEFFVNLLEQILEVIYSIPYYYIVSVNWPIYQSALVALLSKESGLYQCFYDVIYSLRLNGIYVVDNALNRLEHIKKVIDMNEYEKLIDPEMDFMLI